ncbi:MAG TPA: hypothetical protein ENG87_01295 [Candidatus Pacearchaeota archaeon]|nr:hypothetical protein BMS3Abin17_00795 [archaeon BMS3Abin17]HDK41986.1 hypothetical protein [Candidatus Pacearchaeota archaeon]HDZ61479.1 hypothetical protein [Candidatus Pacearchaeota archaeon]
MEYKRKLVDYIKRNLSKGYTLDSLQIALTNQGYSRSIVERAIEQANKELAQKAPVLKEKPVIKYEVIDEYNKPIIIKKPWWKRVFG